MYQPFRRGRVPLVAAALALAAAAAVAQPPGATVESLLSYAR
jgi:hypothetical protein